MTPECKISFPDLGEYRAYFRPIQDQDKRWIPVNIQKPLVEEDVLFCCLLDGYSVRRKKEFTRTRIGWWKGEYVGDESALAMETDADDWCPCTHWMPLPAAPRLPE